MSNATSREPRRDPRAADEDGKRFEKALHLKEATAEQRTARRRTFVASTPAIDSHGEVVEQSWNLERYLKNPVVLWAHDRWSLPIAKTVDIQITPDEFLVEMEFATAEQNEMAECVWQSIEGGFVKAVSIGFWPNEVRQEMRDGKTVYVLADNDIYEISVLPIGSNPDTLAKSLALAVESRILTTKESTPMSTITIEEHQKQISDKDTRISAVEGKLTLSEKALETERAEKIVLEKELATANKKLADETARAAKLEDESIEKEVDALVGDKIDPADREEYLTLRKSSKAVFEKHVARLPSKQHGTEVSKAVKTTTTLPATGRGRSDNDVAGATKSLEDMVGLHDDALDEAN